MTPVENPNVTSVFGPRKSPISGKNENHNGQDLTDAKGNRNLRAIWDTVKTEFVQGYNGGRGSTAYLYYSNTLRVLYQHCASFSPAVLACKKLRQGDSVGVMGTTGDSTGIHLHIEVQVYTGGRWAPVDPSRYTEVPNVRGAHKGNTNRDGNAPAPAGGLYTLTIGPASPGDKKTLETLAAQLSLPVKIQAH